MAISDIDDGCCLSREDVEYALPECLSKTSDIILAIALAKRKLAKLELENEDVVEAKSYRYRIQEEDVIPGQISMWDLIPLTTPISAVPQITQAA